MRIRSADTICRLPALELRRLLRRLAEWDGFDVEDLRCVRPVSRNTAKRLVTNLSRAGYIKPSELDDHGVPRWELSIHGRAFSIASAATPIRRATADRLLRELLNRVDVVNADDGLTMG